MSKQGRANPPIGHGAAATTARGARSDNALCAAGKQAISGQRPEPGH